MTYDPERHHRRSIRLKGYDYSRPGMYFVTICTQKRVCMFGDVVDKKMILNDAGVGSHACPLCNHPTQIGHPAGMSLPDVIHRFKSFTTAKYRLGVKHYEGSPFDRRLWQRNYHDHIIRNKQDLKRIREYIRQNPLMWHTKRDNPEYSFG